MSNTMIIEMPRQTTPFLVLEDDSVFELSRSFFFGANENCDVQRCLPGINKVHFTIDKRNDVWVICDLSYKGNVQVNKEKVYNFRILQNGDVITTEWSEFVFWDVVQ